MSKFGNSARRALAFIIAVRNALRRLPGWIEEYMADVAENLPETVDSFAEGLAAGHRYLSEERRTEKLLKSFVYRNKILFGKRDIIGVYSMLSLADFYAGRRRMHDAEKWYLRAIDILEENLPAGHKRRSEAYSKMGAFYRSYYKDREAEAFLEKAIASKEIECGETGPDLLADLALLSDVRLALGKLKDAESSLLRELAIVESASGAASVAVEPVLMRLINLYRLNGDAIALRKRETHLRLLTAVTIGDSALDDEHPSIARDLDLLAAFLAAEGKAAAAAALRERVKLIRLANKVRGPDYPALPRDLNELADMYEKRGHHADGTLAFHARRRAKLIMEKRSARFTGSKSSGRA